MTSLLTLQPARHTYSNLPKGIWTSIYHAALPKSSAGGAARHPARMLATTLLLTVLGAPAGLLGAQDTLSWNLIHSDGHITNPAGDTVGYFPGTQPPVPSNPEPQPVQSDPQPASGQQSAITWNLIHSDGAVTAPDGTLVGYAPWAQPSTVAPTPPAPLDLNDAQVAAGNALINDWVVSQRQESTARRYQPGHALSLTSTQQDLVARVNNNKPMTDMQKLNFYNAWVMRNKYTNEANAVIAQAQGRTTGTMREVLISRSDIHGNGRDVVVSGRFTDEEIQKLKVDSQGVRTSSLNLWRVMNAPTAPMVQMEPYEGQTWADFATMRFIEDSSDASTKKAGALATARAHEQHYQEDLGAIFGNNPTLKSPNPYIRWLFRLNYSDFANGNYDYKTLKNAGYSDQQINQAQMARMGILVSRYNENAIAQGSAALPYAPIDGQPWSDWYNKVGNAMTYNAVLVNTQITTPTNNNYGPVSTYPTAPSLNNPFVLQVGIPNTNQTLWFNPIVVAPLPGNPMSTNTSQGVVWGIFNPSNPGDGSAGMNGLANGLLGAFFSNAAKAVGTAIGGASLGEAFSKAVSFGTKPANPPIPIANG